jgi:hypothetical protein
MSSRTGLKAAGSTASDKDTTLLVDATAQHVRLLPVRGPKKIQKRNSELWNVRQTHQLGSTVPQAQIGVAAAAAGAECCANCCCLHPRKLQLVSGTNTNASAPATAKFNERPAETKTLSLGRQNDQQTMPCR